MGQGSLGGVLRQGLCGVLVLWTHGIDVHIQPNMAAGFEAGEECPHQDVAINHCVLSLIVMDGDFALCTVLPRAYSMCTR